MHIAVTGTHGSGKTTLIDDFVASHADYEAIPEPYWLLAQNGTPFADGPATADLEEQLVASCRLIQDQPDAAHLVFDRCPLDFLAYLDVVSAGEGFEWLPSGRQLGAIGKAMAALDLVVFVPLVQPDEITTSIEYPALRARVDRRLKTMLRRDDLGLLQDGPRILEVSGSRAERVTQLAAAVGR